MNIRNYLRPGDLGAIVKLHGVLYAREYGLDLSFEGVVAAGLGEFGTTFDLSKDRIWIVEVGGDVAGSIVINGQPDGSAILRWFVLSPELRGQGLGRRLIREALLFCRERGFHSVSLWPISELTVAGRLYREAGFQLVSESTRHFWGGEHTERMYELKL